MNLKMNLKMRIDKLEKLHKDKNKLNEIKVIKWQDGTIIWHKNMTSITSNNLVDEDTPD